MEGRPACSSSLSSTPFPGAVTLWWEVGSGVGRIFLPVTLPCLWIEASGEAFPRHFWKVGCGPEL